LTLILGLLASPPAALAVRPSEELLPSTTKGYLSVYDVDLLEEHFNKTQMGQLAALEQMAPLTGPGSVRHELEMASAKPEQQLGFAADALWDRVRQQIGQSGVDLGEHARLRQAAVHAGNLAGGKPQGFERSGLRGTDDPRYSQQYRNQRDRALSALMEQAGYARPIRP